MLMPKICMVIVTYFPNKDNIRSLIESIIHQVDKIIIIDNTPKPSVSLSDLDSSKIEKVFLMKNYGIAYAQNLGMQMALEMCPDYILLSDQDSKFPKHYIENMLKTFDVDDKVAAIAPTINDSNKDMRDPIIVFDPIFFRQKSPSFGIIEVMQAISSGMIFRAEYLSKIGMMNEYLFIDWVDFEWCWRARKKGYKILVNANISIAHVLGDYSKDLKYRKVNLRSPSRHYYITRNAFYLATRNRNLDIIHRITLFLNSLKYLVGFPVLASPHYQNLRYVALGFYHGIIGRLGELNVTD